MNRNHYVYRITNIIKGKHYYGVRTTKLHPIEDIGKCYFSSSSNKNFIKDQKTNPQNYKYKIVGIFENRVEAARKEILLHAKFDVKNNKNFYNRANAISDGFSPLLDEVAKRKIGDFFRGKPLTLQHREKISIGNMGRVVSRKTRKKISKSNTGKTPSNETKEKLRIINTGKTHTHKTRQKMSASQLGKKNV